MAALLGDGPLGSELWQNAGGPHWNAVLAHASVRAHHREPQIPPRQDEPQRDGGFFSGTRFAREIWSHQRSASLHHGGLFAALPMWLHDRRSAIEGAAKGIGGRWQNGRETIP